MEFNSSLGLPTNIFVDTPFKFEIFKKFTFFKISWELNLNIQYTVLRLTM